MAGARVSRRQVLSGIAGMTAWGTLGGLAACGRSGAPGGGATSATGTSGASGDGDDPLSGTPPRRHDYGPGPEQHGDLYVPAGDRRPGTVVVVHGGFWLAEYTSDLGAPLAKDLARRGHTVWNLEYRRVGNGGGWPNTLLDMATGLDHLAVLAAGGTDLDLSRVLLLGHSAGGQLAVWAAGRAHLPPGSPGAGPRVTPTAVVSQAGVLDLVGADRDGVGGDAVSGFLGGHATALPTRYALASPLARLPVTVPVRCLHSPTDESVPFAQSTTYVDAARRLGGDVELVRMTGSHLDLIDVMSASWAATVPVVEQLLER